MNPNRRDVLRAAGVAGTAGVLGAVSGVAGSPVTALPVRAATASPLGTGAGPDPAQRWDPECDALMRSVLERGEAEKINRVLANWTTNGQPLPAGLPADVRDFIEEARKLPDWLDAGLMADADEFYKARSWYLSLIIGFTGGLMLSVIPREARAVYWSKGGSDMKDRIAKTYKLVYDSIALGAYGPQGRMAVTAVKTRLVHGAVRHLLPQSPHWKESASQELPISQLDMMRTWHSLATMGMRVLRNWEVRLPENQRAGLLHSWQLHGYMLGIDPAYLPKSWAQAESQAHRDFDPIMGPTPEGKRLASMLVDLGRELDLTLVTRPVLEAFTRYSLGDKLTDWMGLPRQPVWETLLETSWPISIKIREGVLPASALAPDVLHLLDEIAKTTQLIYLGELRPVNITIPTTNNPNYH